MRLLATSNGMFTQEEMVPDTSPMVNFLRNSKVGSWTKRQMGLNKEVQLYTNMMAQSVNKDMVICLQNKWRDIVCLSTICN